MPYTVNGIGTWYWGQSNALVQRGTCENCGAFVELKSYDTCNYFVLFFLPIVPLGRKRIIDECPKCRRHRAVKWSVWNRVRNQAIPEAIEKLRVQPPNIDMAKETLVLAVQFQRGVLLDDIVQAAGSTAAKDAEFQHLLGVAYEYFNRLEDAEQSLRAAVNMGNEDAPHTLAVNLLRQRKTDDAWEIVQPMVAERKPGALGLPLLVAESYQTWGMHDAAITVLDAALEAYPKLAGDKDYRKLRRTAEQHRGSDTPVHAELLSPAPQKAVADRAVSNVIARALPALIVILGLGGYWYAAYSAGRAHDVYVVSGMPFPYDVEIDGQRRTLSPQDYRLIELPEGEHTVHVVSSDAPIPDQSFTIETSFLARPFRHQTFVVNPDRLALILWRDVVYSATPDDEAPPEHALHCGDLLTDFTGVDYEFADPPDSLDLPGGRPVHKQYVDLVRNVTTEQAARFIERELGAVRAIDFLRRRVDTGDDMEATWKELEQRIEPPAMIEATAGPRAVRPVRIEAHRFYQEAVKHANPLQDLEGEYRKLLESSPDDPALQYLVARILVDPAQAERLLQRAIASDRTDARSRALNGLAYLRVSNADYEDALSLARRSLELTPDSLTARWQLIGIFAALGRWSDACNTMDKIVASLPGDSWALQHQMVLLGAAGRVSEANAQARQFMDMIDTSMPGVDADEIQANLVASIYYAAGDRGEFLRTAKDAKMPQMRFSRAVVAGELDAAADLIPELTDSEGISLLTLSIVARHAGDKTLADECLQDAIAALNAGDAEQRRLAEWLAAEEITDHDAVRQSVLSPQDKRVAMVAMGMKYPDQRDAYFALARKLNCDPLFPRLELDVVLNAAAADAATP